jgi:hypothetical protein
VTAPRYVSLGWGVQSFTLAAMAAEGELGDARIVAIHADTGHERAATRAFRDEWAPWLESRGVRYEEVRPIPSRTLEHQLAAHSAVTIPAYTLNADGSKGQINRQCTQNWKIRPIEKAIRRDVGRLGEAVQLLGISLDEIGRARSDEEGRRLRRAYPLLDLRLDRAGCVAWLERHGLPVPRKSACTFCPYQRPDWWRRLRERGGADYEEAVAVDEAIRDARPNCRTFVHPSLRPLKDLRTAADFGYEQAELFGCDEGYCFV